MEKGSPTSSPGSTTATSAVDRYVARSSVRARLRKFIDGGPSAT